METRTHRLLHRLANVGLALALLLACVPFGMRAYGHWSEARARQMVAPTLRRATDGAARQAMRPPMKSPPRQSFKTSVLDIPSVGVEAVVEEGSGNWSMMLGAGHEPRSAGAGGAGNCVIAAHRNMWGAPFANLPGLRPGDLIRVTDDKNVYTYQVNVSKEISARDRRYLAQTRDARLTLYTCVLPFDADRRWIVQAHLVDRD